MFVLLLRILSLDLVVIPFIGRRGIGSEREGKEIGKGGTGEVGMLLECNSVSVAEDTAEIGPSEFSYFVVFEIKNWKTAQVQEPLSAHNCHHLF